ncbi:MAG: sensor histidine kinase [Candidatus Saccharimonadales bacterium]
MEAQSQFVSDASRELRTPLAVLQTTNEIALRNKKLPAKTARELIAYNVEEAKKLRDLSNVLLDLSKQTDSIAQLSEVPLQAVVSDALPTIVTLAQAKDITIDDTLPNLTVQTNRALLTRIMAILLDNAVKYSDAKSSVKLSATQDGPRVLLRVIDNGAGIHATDLPHIFRRFYRADKSRTTHATQGYGLGLALAEKIATQIHANITVKSEPGKGSTFTVTLPASSTSLE